jgi:hypothetical protein
VLGLIDHHYHGRIWNGRPSGLEVLRRSDWNSWYRIWHETVGGVTKYAALFCCSEEMTPRITTIRRTLAHVIDYSILPTCVRASNPWIPTALTLTDRLYAGHLQQHLFYRSHFCCSGQGSRALSLNYQQTCPRIWIACNQSGWRIVSR